MLELSSKLWSYIGVCIADKVHAGREALVRGEKDNDFELWRNL